MRVTTLGLFLIIAASGGIAAFSLFETSTSTFLPHPVETTKNYVAHANALLKQWQDKKERDAIDLGELIRLQIQLEAVPTTDPLRSDASRLATALMPARQFLGDRAMEETKRKTWEKEETRKLTIAKTATVREKLARDLEEEYLKKGMDVRVKAEGQNSTTLKVQYVLMSRPLVYQLMQRRDFLDGLYRSGFSKLMLSDGYRQSWSCDVTDFTVCPIPQ